MKIFFKKITALVVISFMLFSSSNMVLSNKVVYASNTNISACDEIGKTYYGFELTSIKEIPKINSSVMLFTHVKTGAKLMYVSNEDIQRVFDISFRTPTLDNTGVNHIIEHSVLDGSKNYPVKSPFTELLKSSLGSFINAMTSSDYTTYPVASTNEKDLKNLMSVYLDGVFYPNFTTNFNIFKQEGWRYELPSADSNLSINGIVYNEMKGNYSNPDYILHNAKMQSLFPDTSHRWDAGGNPEEIPNLTIEQLVSTYKKNYSPSNSYIYLYGKLNIEEYLEFIDQNYLSKFDKVETNTSIKPQEPLSNIPVKTVYYSIPEDSDTKNKTYLSLNFVTGTIDNREENISLSFLNYLLMGTDNAPLKKALAAKGIAVNVTSSFNMEGIQPTFSIDASNSNESSSEVFKQTIFSTLQDIYKNGFDENFLKSALASYDISANSEELILPSLGGTGLLLSQTTLATWIYDKDPTMYFDTDDIMEKIKKTDENEYFKNLINKYFLTNNYYSLVIMKPEVGLDSTSSKTLAEKLQTYKNSLDETTINSLVKDTEDFTSWQESEDSKEALDTLPKLSLDDIEFELPNLSYRVENQSGVKILSHVQDLNGLSTLNFYFDTSSVPQDELHYLSLLSSLLGSVDTKKHTSEELSNKMMENAGGPISFIPSAITDSKNLTKYSPKIIVSMLLPEDTIDESLDIIKEIVNESSFENKDKIKQIIEQNKAALQSIFTSGSGSAALMAMNSYMSEGGKYNEELSGVSYYKFLQNLDDNFDSKWGDIRKNLNSTYKLAFNKNNLIASCSGSNSSIKKFKTELNRISSEITSKNIPQQDYTFTETNKNIAFSSSAKVQTILQGGTLKGTGYSYSGKMMVLQNILNTEYLWNELRTSGGAYGGQISISSDGKVILASIRDPNIKETFETFKNTVDYLKNFQASEDEMTKYIIGAIKEFVNLKISGPLVESALCDSIYLTGFSPNDLLKYEKEALSTTPEDIRDYGNMLDKVLNQNIYFLEGSSDKIQQNKELFNEIVDTGK